MRDWPSFDQRILVNVAATLSFQGVDSDGTVADPGTVTVTVARANGTAIAADAATSGTGTSARTYSLSAANNGYLDWLTATWKVAGTTIGTTKIEVVGAYYASVAEIRAADPALADYAKYPDARVIRARWEAEREAEMACDGSFVPRYRRVRLDGTGTGRLDLPDPMLRSVRSVRTYTSDTDYDSFTAAEVAAIPADSRGIAVRTDGEIWPTGHSNVLIEYEHGWDRPPTDLLREWFLRVRWQLNRERTGIADRAISYTTAEGISVDLLPGRSGSMTGLPDYDAVLRRYNMGVPIG